VVLAVKKKQYFRQFLERHQIFLESRRHISTQLSRHEGVKDDETGSINDFIVRASIF
jgi:hypothetical protein